MNLQDLDKIRLYKKVDGTFWYVNAAGQWVQFVVGGGGGGLANAKNGLSVSGGDVELGGTLEKTTAIDGDGNIFEVTNVSEMTLESTNDINVRAAKDVSITAEKEIDIRATDYFSVFTPEVGNVQADKGLTLISVNGNVAANCNDRGAFILSSISNLNNIISPVTGMVIVDTSTNPALFKAYNGVAWVTLQTA